MGASRSASPRLALAYWDEQFRRRMSPTGCPSGLPEDYLALDIETSGSDRKTDLVLEIGYCLVRGCRVVSRGSYLLNWEGWPGVSLSWLDERINQVRRAIEFDRKTGRPTGQTFGITLDLLREHGWPPVKVMEFFAHFFNWVLSQKALVVGQNFWQFDYPRIRDCFAQTLGVDDFELTPWQVIDAGLLVRGNAVARGHDSPAKVLAPNGHTAREYFQQLRYAPFKGALWNMRYCLETYGLLDKPGLNARSLHRASTDAYATHLLTEALRKEALAYVSRD